MRDEVMEIEWDLESGGGRHLLVHHRLLNPALFPLLRLS